MTITSPTRAELTTTHRLRAPPPAANGAECDRLGRADRRASPARRGRLVRRLAARIRRLTARDGAQGTLIRLNPEHRPYSFLARSDPNDVARVEARTFICSDDPDDAGPTNNWRDPPRCARRSPRCSTAACAAARCTSCRSRMGPLGGPLAQIGVQLTDSPYVVVSMGIMTRMGQRRPAADHRQDAMGPRRPQRRRAAAATGDTDVAWPCNDTKYISHFPETREIWSFGSRTAETPCSPRRPSRCASPR